MSVLTASEFTLIRKRADLAKAAWTLYLDASRELGKLVNPENDIAKTDAQDDFIQGNGTLHHMLEKHGLQWP
jgi:hypothetical protein